MKLLPLAAATVFALTAPPAWSNPASQTELTIYSGGYEALGRHGDASSGYALVRERHRFDLDAGTDTISLDRLPAGLDVAGVDLQPLGDARVLGQRYDFALAGQDALLQRSIGQTVTVEHAVGNSRERLTGTLLAAGNGLTLALPNGRIRVLSSYSGFELAELPDGLSARPGLQWQVDSPGGNQDFQLDYPTAGLAWRAEYRALLAAGTGCRMDLDGFAQVANRSGMAFPQARLTLVAGEPRRVSESAPRQEMMMRSQAATPVMYDSPAEPTRSGEYHAYTLPTATALPDGSIQQVRLIEAATAIPCQRRYEVRAPIGIYRGSTPVVQRQLGGDGAIPVTVNLGFDNRESAGLGMPLPAGRVRVLDQGELLGEASLGHTAANEAVDLALGTAFDLNAQRRATDFSLDRSGRTMTESIQVELHNAGARAARIEVHESLPRWTDWEIVDASSGHDKTDAQTVRFDVDVPAGGSTTLAYTVRYRWPADIRIP